MPVRRLWAAALLLLALTGTSIRTGMGDVDRTAGTYERDNRGLELFASPRVVLATNQFQCILDNIGGVCTYSPDLGGGGGWFPTGTPDEYVFNSGFQIAGITPADAGPWALDTAGAYFYDGRRGEPHGTALTPIYDSRDQDDLANWPQEAYISDPEVFAPVLQGRRTASQNDTWVQYWDGDPARNGEREHPMGIRITQRSMVWNYPSGNESVIYFVLDFENVTNDPEFQRLNELAFFGGDDELPDGGWAYEDVYLSFAADHDVGFALENFATGILPFDLLIAYHGGFNVGGVGGIWQFPPNVFYPPFFTDAPGIAGVKYLKSPIDPETGRETGVSMMSVYTIGQSSPFPDPIGTNQLWRYLSGNLDLNAGDPPCNVTAEIETLSVATTERSVCYVPISSWDIRFYSASGPTTIGPGERATIVAAHLVAPTVATMPDGSPSGVIANTSNLDANPPGVPSFHPGFASARGCDTSGSNCTDVLAASENAVKPIERAAGWVAYNGPPPAGDVYPPEVEHPSNRIDQFGVEVVPGSLLGRALVAQTVFENDFLLGFPPDPPAFYLVPGNESVTVMWDPSPTETVGDPFYDVAGDPESALYNPNYRQFDVEGYRVWRGTTRGQLELVAQFDFEHTRFYDYTCETVHPLEDVGALAESQETGNLVPVIGFAAGEVCPATAEDPLVRRIDGSLVFNNGGPGGAPGGGVSRNPATVAIDTAILSDRDIGEVEPLADTGVPYVYVDQGVQNSFTYFYAVTAFDVNSMTSGPHTLRSVMIDQLTTPRQDAQNLTPFAFSVSISGDDGVALDTEGPLPTVDEATGIFSGAFPPTNAFRDLLLNPLVDRLLSEGNTPVRIDSILVRATGNPPGSQEWPPSATGYCRTGYIDGQIASAFGACWEMHLTAILPDGSTEAAEIDGYSPWWNAFGRPGMYSSTHIAADVPFDSTALADFGIPEGATVTASFTWTESEAQNYTAAEGAINRRRGHYATGARWFDGDSRTTGNTIAHPSRLTRVGHVGAADTIWAPIPYTPTEGGGSPVGGFDSQCMNRALAFLDRAADVVWTWSGGTLTARDVTHNVDVPFDHRAGPTWGFLTTDANGNGVIDWHDFNYIEGAIEVMRQVDGGNCNAFGATSFDAGGTASAVQLTSTASLVATSTEGIGNAGSIDLENGGPLPQTGTGFGLFAYGHRFIFEMSSLPADGTVWTLRTYRGELVTDDDSALEPTGYTYTINGAGGSCDGSYCPRPALIPGLTFNYDVESANAVRAAWDLSDVHTVPDPYLATSEFGLSPTTKQLMFVNLPSEATIRIYSLTGVLVNQIDHYDPTGGGRAVWDLRNRSNQFVASGVYFFHVITPQRDERVGKFTIVIGTQ